MKLSQVLALNSERGIRSALSALMFGAKQRLLSASVTHSRIANTIHQLRQAGYNDRASDVENGKAHKLAEGRAIEAAEQLSKLVAAGDCLGIVIDIEIEPTMRRLMDAKQLRLAAEFSGVDAETIQKAALTSAQSQFEAEQQASLHAKTLFYSASGSDTDMEVKAESVLAALVRERARILTYSNVMLYLGELGLLKQDIETVEALAHNEADHVHSGEGDIDGDAVQTFVPTADSVPHATKLALANAEAAKRIAEGLAEAPVEKKERKLRRTNKAGEVITG